MSFRNRSNPSNSIPNCNQINGGIFPDFTTAMGSIVLTTLSIFLGLFYVFVGILKVTPVVHHEMHREIRRNFLQYSKVFPLADHMKFKVDPKYYRLTYGILEILAGTILTLTPWNRIKLGSNILLIMTTLLTVYTQFQLQDRFERIAPSLVFILMLTCRIIVNYQVKRREAKEAEEKELEDVNLRMTRYKTSLEKNRPKDE